MFKVIHKQVRPNTSVPFHAADTSETISAACKQYFFENYILTGKNIDHSHTHSDDELTCETTTIWESEEAFNQFKNDPGCAEIVNDMANHVAENQIVKTSEKSPV